jgi:hypothetical protein
LRKGTHYLHLRIHGYRRPPDAFSECTTTVKNQVYSRPSMSETAVPRVLRPGLADPVNETQQAIFDTGTGVGELARVPKPPSYYRDNRRRLVGKGHLKTKLGDRRN